MHTPKSTPATRPEAISRAGMTLPSVVPGGTVLRTTIRGWPFVYRMPFPTARAASRTNDASTCPSTVGVGTETRYVEAESGGSSAARTAWYPRPRRRVTRWEFVSQKTTLCPLAANPAPVAVPTTPEPTTAMSRSGCCIPVSCSGVVQEGATTFHPAVSLYRRALTRVFGQVYLPLST